MSQPKKAEAKISEQAAPMEVEPTREHRWLQRLVGDWT